MTFPDQKLMAVPDLGEMPSAIPGGVKTVLKLIRGITSGFNRQSLLGAARLCRADVSAASRSAIVLQSFGASQ
ncbi:MAG: hypothetical protein COB16_12455 [Rhodobacteraceae bacterium]|nr:MAG: hypothetical protein COB16_12455 [Paracoccaceae bacterium]